MSTIETNVVKPSMKFMHHEVEYNLLDTDIESKLDSKLLEIESFIKSNDGKGQSEDVKNTMYADAQKLYWEFIEIIKDVKYNFYLNRNQYNFITNLIKTKLEFDVNTVFFAIELSDMMSNLEKTKYLNDDEIIPVKVNTTEMTYVYHLISKHKVKGLTKEAYVFAQILRRIGEVSKIFNYYDATGKNSHADITNWVAAFEEGVTLEDRKELEFDTVEGTVSMPSKSSK